MTKDDRKYSATQQEILEWIDEELAEHQGIDNEFHRGAVEALSKLQIKIVDNVRPLCGRQYWSYGCPR